MSVPFDVLHQALMFLDDKVGPHDRHARDVISQMRDLVDTLHGISHEHKDSREDNWTALPTSKLRLAIQFSNEAERSRRLEKIGRRYD